MRNKKSFIKVMGFVLAAVFLFAISANAGDKGRPRQLTVKTHKVTKFNKVSKVHKVHTFGHAVPDGVGGSGKGPSNIAAPPNLGMTEPGAKPGNMPDPIGSPTSTPGLKKGYFMGRYLELRGEDAPKLIGENGFKGLSEKENLPHEDRTAPLQEFGSKEDPFGEFGLGDYFGSSNKQVEGMLPDLSLGLNNPFVGKGPGPNDVYAAFRGAGNDVDGFIGGLNKANDDYWGQALDNIRGSGGGIHSGSSTQNRLIAPRGGYSFSRVVNQITHMSTDGSAVLVREKYADGSESLWHIDDGGPTRLELEYNNPGSSRMKKKTNGGTKVSDDPGGGEVGEGGIPSRAPGEPYAIQVENPKDKPKVKRVQTDMGTVIISDFDQLGDAAKTSPDDRIAVGVNPLTGQDIKVRPGVADPRAKMGKFFKQKKDNPRVDPRTAQETGSTE